MKLMNPQVCLLPICTSFNVVHVQIAVLGHMLCPLCLPSFGQTGRHGCISTGHAASHVPGAAMSFDASFALGGELQVQVK